VTVSETDKETKIAESTFIVTTSLLHPRAGQQTPSAHGVTEWRHQVVDERLLQLGQLRRPPVHVRGDGHAQRGLLVALAIQNNRNYITVLQMVYNTDFSLHSHNLNLLELRTPIGFCWFKKFVQTGDVGYEKLLLTHSIFNW
jgi:uncharacterized iron-regulated protein